MQVELLASYSYHYWVGMVKLLRTLVFRSNNTARAPIIAGTGRVVRTMFEVCLFRALRDRPHEP